MKWIFIFSMLLASTTIFGQDEQNKALQKKPTLQKTSIRGTIVHPDKSDVTLRFFRDFISFDEESFHIPVDSLKGFAIEFDLSQAVPAFLTYQNQTVTIFIEPGNDLSLNFNSLAFPKEIEASGIGGVENEFLIKYQREFNHIDEDQLIYEIVSREPFRFRYFMDDLHHRKRFFLLNYDRKKRLSFSKAFEHYIYSEIDYWKAYYLLRYPKEHAQSNGGELKSELPANYYDFLNEVLISNDFSLNNQHYIFFLDQFLRWMGEQNDNIQKEQFLYNEALIEASSMMILSEPNKPPVLMEAQKGERLKYLGEQSKLKSQVFIKGEYKEGYWYKVQANNGTVGWLIGVGVRFDEASYKNDPKYQNAKNLLSGKTRDYIIAKDLYWRSQLDKNESLKAEIIAFGKDSQSPDYLQLVEKEFGGFASTDEGATPAPTNFKIVQNINILSLRSNGKTRKLNDGGLFIHEDIRIPAPGFELKDINGKTVKLSDFKDKVVFIDFWASWCSPCLYQMRNSRIWKKDFIGQDVVFLYISTDQDQNMWRTFVNNLQLEGVNANTTNGNQAASLVPLNYGVNKLPRQFLIDRKGRIAFDTATAKVGGTMAERIQLLLRE